MKKTVKMPDGSESVIEGTPEEIAEFERQQKKGAIHEVPKKSNKRILLKDDFDKIFEGFDDIFKKMDRQFERVQYVPYHSHCVGCATCQPYKFTPPSSPWRDTIWCETATMTSNKIEMDIDHRGNVKIKS